MDNNNKYLFDIDTLTEKEQEEAKAIRRKKHKQGRIIAWIVLIAAVLVACLVLFLGVKAIIKGVKGAGGNTVVSDGANPSDSGGDDSVLDDLLGDEEVVSVPPSEPVDNTPSEEELFEEAVRNYVRNMTLEEQVFGLFIVTPEQITGVSAAIKAGDGTKAALEKYPVGGLIYSDKNMLDPQQFSTMIEGTKNYSKYPLFIAVDERLGRSVFPAKMKVAAVKSAQELAAGGDASLVKEEESKIAGYLSGFGINLNLGIVADVSAAPVEGTSLPAWSFGTDTNTVAEMVVKSVQALRENGIYSGVMFFPGQGFASADTAEAIASCERTREEMDSCELIPFKAAADAGATMFVISHETVSGLSEGSEYASQSKAVMTNLIRVEMGLDDIILITDDLTKTAVSAYFESGEACIASLKAGADMLLKPEDFGKAYAEVLNAVNTGVIARERIEDSLVRIYKVKFSGKTSDEVNSITAEKIVSGQ